MVYLPVAAISIGRLFRVGGLLSLVDILRPYAPLVVPLFWISFVVAAAVAVSLYQKRYVRKTFVVGFFIGLIFFSTIAPVTLLPYIQWHKFSTPWPEVVEKHELRVVDEHGNEIRLDDRATLKFDAVRMNGLITRMVADYSDEKNEAIARELITKAETYRDRLQRPSLLRYVQFPHHGHANTWSVDQLEEYGNFVGIRVYRLRIHTTPDGTEVTEYEQTLELEVMFDEPPETAGQETERSSNRVIPDILGDRTVCGGANPVCS